VNYIAVGIALLVIGIGMLVTSFIQIPMGTPTHTTVGRVLLEETFTVDSGSASAYCVRFRDRTNLTIYVRVISGGNRDINFWVMDKEDWERFKRSESFYYYTTPSRKRIVEATITWSPPSYREICFVYDNTFSTITSKTVYTRIEQTAYERKVEHLSLSFLAVPGIILSIIGLGLIIGGVAVRFSTTASST